MCVLPLCAASALLACALLGPQRFSTKLGESQNKNTELAAAGHERATLCVHSGVGTVSGVG